MSKLREYLELVMFKHTVFALPFALLGAFLGARGAPSWTTLGWLLVAVVAARTSAMAFNRVVDRRFDGRNPRTAARALPAGRVRRVEAVLIVLVAGAVFVWACSRLNPLAFRLAPGILILLLGYSLAKRVTWMSHVMLGAALALAPIGGFVAVRGLIDGYPWSLSLGVLLWVAGFDIVYACQDTDVDRHFGLQSIPARFGPDRAFGLARAFHVLAFALFVITGIGAELAWPYYVGLAIAGAALLHQHRLVEPTDLRRIHRAFFQMNGLVSLTLFVGTWIALVLE